MKLKLKKILAAPFVIIAAIIVLLEDWLWDDLVRLTAIIGRLPVLRQIESIIINLPPYAKIDTTGCSAVNVKESKTRTNRRRDSSGQDMP